MFAQWEVLSQPFFEVCPPPSEGTFDQTCANYPFALPAGHHRHTQTSHSGSNPISRAEASRERCSDTASKHTQQEGSVSCVCTGRERLLGDLVVLWGVLRPREEEGHSVEAFLALAVQKELKPPLTCLLLCLTVWCTCLAASTACCWATSSCIPRPAARPSLARRPASTPGRGSTAPGTPPRGSARRGKATPSFPSCSCSYRLPVTPDHVGDTSLKCCPGRRLLCETNPQWFQILDVFLECVRNSSAFTALMSDEMHRLPETACLSRTAVFHIKERKWQKMCHQGVSVCVCVSVCKCLMCKNVCIIKKLSFLLKMNGVIMTLIIDSLNHSSVDSSEDSSSQFAACFWHEDWIVWSINLSRTEVPWYILDVGRWTTDTLLTYRSMSIYLVDSIFTFSKLPWWAETKKEQELLKPQIWQKEAGGYFTGFQPEVGAFKGMKKMERNII